MNYETTYIETNNINLHVTIVGPKEGKPVVLLHGFPEFWYGWRKQIPVLTKAGYRVIVPDQRGYNLSEKPRGIKAYRLEALGKDILGLIDFLGHEKVHLVGHDWGAAVAWNFAQWYSDRLDRLVIMNVPHPAVMSRFLSRDFEQLLRSWYIVLFQLPWLPEFFLRMNDWRNGVRVLGSSGKSSSFSKDDIAKYKQAWSQPGAIRSMVNWYRALFWFRPRLSEGMLVKSPMLMIWGMQDVALSYRMARPSLDYCQDGVLVFFEDSSHWVQHDEAEAVNQLLLEFLSGKYTLQEASK